MIIDLGVQYHLKHVVLVGTVLNTSSPKHQANAWELDSPLIQFTKYIHVSRLLATLKKNINLQHSRITVKAYVPTLF